MLVLLFGGFVFFILNTLSRQKEERKKKEIALEKSLTQTKAKLARERKGLPIVSKMAETVFLTSDAEIIAANIQDFIEKVLGVDLYSLFVLDKKQKKSHLINKNVSTSLLGEVSRAVLGRNVSGPFEEGSLILKGITLFDLNEVLGVFFAKQEVINNLSIEDTSWLNLIAKQLVLADKGKALDLRAAELATTEEATALFNYQFFKKQLETEWERAQRYNRCLSLVLLDVDDFNVYQDKFGQEQKELTLMEISQILKDSCRRLDIVAHYAGDELAIILPETDVSGAFVAAERIREAISRQAFLGGEGKREARLTASLGVASYPLNTADMEGLAREVESALYNAKITGRNRVCGPELPA